MNRRRVVVALAVVLLLGGGLAVWWFEPQARFMDETVDEPAPRQLRTIILGGTEAVAEPPDPPTAPLRGIEGHEGTGTAEVLTTRDGRVLRLELDFENGPDLRLYLSSAPADGDPDALDDDIVDLGALKGNKGGQNYVLPDDVELDRYRTVVIWCRRFSVGFGAGTLA